MCRRKERCCRWRKWSRRKSRIRFHWRWPTKSSTQSCVSTLYIHAFQHVVINYTGFSFFLHGVQTTKGVLTTGPTRLQLNAYSSDRPIRISIKNTKKKFAYIFFLELYVHQKNYIFYEQNNFCNAHAVWHLYWRVGARACRKIRILQTTNFKNTGKGDIHFQYPTPILFNWW